MAEEIKKKKTRMYDPWGYQDENNYQSSENQFEIELNELFASANYDETDKKIHFFNNDGKELSGSSIDTTMFAPGVVQEAYYDSTTKELVIVFDGGSTVRINMAEIIDENEFGDGLQVDGSGIVSVKIDETSDPYLTVGTDGIKIFGVKDAIEAEIERATSAETILNEKIDNEIDRAISAETALDNKIDNEISRATSAETALQNALNDEISRSINADETLNAKIDQEISDRIADVNAEEARAKSAESALTDALNAEIARSTREDNVHDDELRVLDSRVDLLNSKIDNEISRAEMEEASINDRIDDIISGNTPIAKLENLIEKLGYKDNDTLVTNNVHEVAFGEWNVSNSDTEPSGQTIFSIGIGTDDSNRKNALEVRKNGDVYIWIEDDFMAINDLLGQIAHEVYDNDSSNP